jgi:asparagine N-glycosylation enzyme membrane subunit Stt3
MATLLQSLGIFTDIFDFFLPFLLVFATLYAIFMKTKVLSESANVNGVIAFAIALIVALSGAGKFIVTLTPYLAVLFVIVFLLFLSFLLFGVKPEWIFNTKGPATVILLVGVIFVLYVVGTLYGGSMSTIGGTETTSTATGVTAEETTTGGTTTTTVTATENLPGPETCDFAHMTSGRAMTCLIGNPKVLGVIILLGLLAIATFFVVYVPKNA